MNLPPFPAQDLAKLVLGYLAEEQLMTAYDEFLQASPYLDAFGNEYDRIFMTSLKNILAEYRAVKIYVETCKPFPLRRKLFQCTSLLEIVKFLIHNVDLNKILTQEQNQSKCSVEKQITGDKVDCEVCRSSKLETCTCNVRSSNTDGPSKPNYEDSVLDSSIEATSLSDLPGNHVTERKKIVCVSDSTTSDVNNINSVRLPNSRIPLEKIDITNNTSPSVQLTSESITSQNDNYSVKHPDPGIPSQPKQNEVVNHVCHQNQRVTMSDNKQVLMGNYKNFAFGVNGGSGGTIIVPDTSSSEKVYYQIPISGEEIVQTNKFIGTKVKHTRTQYLLKVATVNNSTKPNEVVTITTTNNRILPKPPPEATSKPTPKPTADDNKVKILSDVKVDNSISSDGSMKMPSVLKNATSTPLLKMQTVVINGTPVYKQKPEFNYTKDEIMAMPTIILAPASGPPAPSVCSITQDPPPMIESNKPRSLGPLTIDVCTEHLDDDVPNNQPLEERNANNDNEIKDANIPKTFDITSASAPKDTNVTGQAETSTPQVLPPVRKSSSTPRRTSHVRVLDFTTPRRILHESRNKCITISEDVEVVSGTTEIINPEPDKQNNEKDTVCDSTKENAVTNKTVLGKKGNWDADLRALAVAAQVAQAGNITNPAPKPRPRTGKKKKQSNDLTTKNVDEKQNKEREDKKTRKKRMPKTKSAKKYFPEPPEEADLFKDKVNIPVKPTINIISGGDRGAALVSTVAESDKSQNKSNEENVNDTPELERMSLQNEIGAKLNISDLLETPYKQALYDIQMETPRFLGPDLPDDPMSDIKIMNIPTPKFLNSIPTPSSYSSRPTDYSSGGSYYKPDDQDYMRITDDMICPVTSSVSKESIKSDASNNKETDHSDNNEKNNDKPTRPVRQCTKNVSYYNSSNLKKDVADSDITDSSFCESIIEKETKNISCRKENKSKICNKSDIKLSTKKKRSPKKEASKSFMKIKPRRPTPKKDIGKRRKTTPESSKAQGRKRITKQDERKAGGTPLISSVPTKSRRKSSTPRKLHCTKSFNSESSGHDSPELLGKAKENTRDSNIVITHDSDTEQLPLRWSDDGSQSQDTKTKEVETNVVNESEDISKIQEYLKTSAKDDDLSKEGRLHIDLVKRGFDLETAKIIERELLDASPHTTQDFAVTSDIIITAATPQVTEPATETMSNVAVLEKTLESDCSTSNNLQIVQDDDQEDEEIEEVEMAVHECNADTNNFFSLCHDDTKDVPQKELPKLKDKFSMEVCLDEDLSIRLRATQFSILYDQEPDDNLLNYDEKETEMAVRSISNVDSTSLNTPLKQAIKDQCYEIFDSTLTSLDTPLKPRSPKLREEVTVTEIVLEVENLEGREKVDTKKRKRAQSGNMSDENESKKAKPEAQYLLNSANIQNIDIESVLSKLHGP